MIVQSQHTLLLLNRQTQYLFQDLKASIKENKPSVFGTILRWIICEWERADYSYNTNFLDIDSVKEENLKATKWRTKLESDILFENFDIKLSQLVKEMKILLDKNKKQPFIDYSEKQFNSVIFPNAIHNLPKITEEDRIVITYTYNSYALDNWKIDEKVRELLFSNR